MDELDAAICGRRDEPPFLYHLVDGAVVILRYVVGRNEWIDNQQVDFPFDEFGNEVLNDRLLNNHLIALSVRGAQGLFSAVDEQPVVEVRGGDLIMMANGLDAPH
jgi:hypothetical protein